MNIYMIADYTSNQRPRPNILRAIGQALVFTPTQPASLFAEATRVSIEEFTRYFLSRGASNEAAHKAVVGNLERKRAFILAFSDAFYLLGVALIVPLVAAALLKRPGQLEGGGAH